MLPPDWAEKVFVLFCPIGEQELLRYFAVFLHEHCFIGHTSLDHICEGNVHFNLLQRAIEIREIISNVIRKKLYVSSGNFSLRPIKGIVKYNTSQRKLRSSSQHLLATPKARLKTYGERAFAVAAPRLWNSIPLELRSSSSIDIFKRHLKTYLFKQAF